MGRFEQRASAPTHHLTFCNNTELGLASNSHWSPYSLFRFVTNVQSLSVSICATCVHHWRGSGTFWIAVVSWLANTVVNYEFSVYNLRQRWICISRVAGLKEGEGVTTLSLHLPWIHSPSIAVALWTLMQGLLPPLYSDHHAGERGPRIWTLNPAGIYLIIKQMWKQLTRVFWDME